MTAAWMRPSRAAHTVPPSLLLRSRREHNRDRLRIERLAALVEVALLGQRCRDPPQAQRPPPFGFLRASRFASATTSGRVSTWLLRPRPSRRHALAPPRRCKLGHKGRLIELSDRAQHLTHQHGGRFVLDKVDGRPAVPPCPPTALPSRSLESGRGRQGLSARRSGVGQFGSRRARLSPRALAASSAAVAQGLASAPRRTLPAPRAADRGAGREETGVFDGAPDRRR